MKTKVLIRWSAATILCGGVAHAQAQPPPPPRAAAQPAPQAAANGEPARAQPAPRAVRQVAKPAPAPAAKASGAEESPYGNDEAEGDDGANGAKPTEGAKAPEGAKTTAVAKPAAVVPVAAPVPALSPAGVSGVGAPIAVDGAVIMGMMGSNMNQTMRRGVTAQVTKLSKGISIAYVSDDPKVIERLQQMADAMRLIRDAWSD